MTQDTDTRTRPSPAGCAFPALIAVGLAVTGVCGIPGLSNSAGIATAAPWTAERHRSGITVTVGHTPGPTCFRYDIPLPVVTSEPTVHRTRLATCPTLPNR
ncbi:hypothetical protein ACVNF4_12980 [Streptomyces sp. S6]